MNKTSSCECYITVSSHKECGLYFKCRTLNKHRPVQTAVVQCTKITTTRTACDTGDEFLSTVLWSIIISRIDEKNVILNILTHLNTTISSAAQKCLN